MCNLQSTTHNFGLHSGHCAGFPRYMHSLNIRPQTLIRASMRHHSCRQQARASAPDGREPACRAQIQMGRLPLGLLAPASIALPARADVSESLQQGSALIQKDAVISVAFTVAVIALGAVTLGVLYLSTLTFLDNRAEKKEREQFEKALQDKEARLAAGGKISSKPKQPKKKKGKTQGFG